MNIYIAGIYRSGSTWLFNAVRLIMEQESKTVASGFIWKTTKKGKSKADMVIKTHFFYDDIELPYKPDIVITSIRDKSEIQSSMMKQRAKGLEPHFFNAGNWEQLNEFFEWLFKWRSHEKHVYEMDYKDLESGNQKKIVTELLQVLNFEVNETKVLHICKELKKMTAPKQGFNETTLLTPTHRK